MQTCISKGDGNMVELYNPMNPKAKPIKIKLTKSELYQMVFGLYRKVDQHPVGRSGRRG